MRPEDYPAIHNNNTNISCSTIDLDTKESMHKLLSTNWSSPLRHDTRTPHAPRRHSHPKRDIPPRRDDCVMYMNTNTHLKKRNMNMNTLFLSNDKEGDENGIPVSRGRREGEEDSESPHTFLITKVTSTPHFGKQPHSGAYEDTNNNWGKKTDNRNQKEEEKHGIWDKENRSFFPPPEGRMLLPYHNTSKRTNRVPFSELKQNQKTGSGGRHGKGDETDDDEDEDDDDDDVVLSRDLEENGNGNENEEDKNESNHCYLDENIYSTSIPVADEENLDEEEENPKEADDEFSIGVCIAGAEADRMMRNRAKVVLFDKDGEVENHDEALEKDKEELLPYPVSATPDWEEKRYDHHGFQEILLRCERYEAMGGTVNMQNTHNMNNMNSMNNMNMNSMNHMHVNTHMNMNMNFAEGLHQTPYCGSATPQGGEEGSPLEDGACGGEHSMHAPCGENGDDANAHAISSNVGGLMSMSMYDQATNQQWQQGIHHQWGTHNGAYDLWLPPDLSNNNVSSQTTFASNGGLGGLHSTFEGGVIPMSPQLSLAVGGGKSTTPSHMGYSSLNSMSTNQNQFYGQGNAASHHQNNMGQNTHGQHQPPTSIHSAGHSGSNGYGGAAMDNMSGGGGSMMNGSVTGGGQLDHNMSTHGGGGLNQGGYYGGSSPGWGEDGNNSGAVYLDLSHALPIDSHNHSLAHNTILQQQMAMVCDTGVSNNGNGQLPGICQMPPSPGQMNMVTTPTTAPNTPPNHMEGKATWEQNNGEDGTTAANTPMSPPESCTTYPENGNHASPPNNLSIMNMLRNPPPPTSPLKRHHSNERRAQSMNVARSQSMHFTREHERGTELRGQSMNVARSQSLLSIGHQHSMHSLTNVVGGSLDSRGPHDGKLEHIDLKGKWEVTSQSDENENWEPPAYDANGVSSACDGNRMPSGATKGTRGSNTWYNEHSSARGQGQQRHGGLPPPPPPTPSRGVPPSPHMIPPSWRNGGSRHHNQGHHHGHHHGHYKNYNNHNSMSHSPFVSTNGMDVGKNGGGHHPNNGAATAHEKTNFAAATTSGAPGGREHASKNGGGGGERENMPNTTAAPHNGDLFLTGDFLTMAKTQAGSKYLQRSLQERNRSAMDYIFHQVETAAPSLMCDKYANYLCSQVFVASDQRYRRRLLGKILPNIKEIACDKRGTHALQALIQVLGSGLGSSSPEGGGEGGGGDPAGEQQLREDNWTTRSRRRAMHGEDNNYVSNTDEGHDNECEYRWGNASSSSSPRHMTDDYDFIDEQQIKFVKALRKDLAVCAMDPNGTHAVQKTLQCFRMPATDVVLKEILDRFLELAHNAHGLCVLKVCITCSIDNGSLWSTGIRGAPTSSGVDSRPTSGPTTAEVSASSYKSTIIKRPRDAILEQLTLHALDLVQSPYGNYAVQHALEEYAKADWMPFHHADCPADMDDGDYIWNGNTPYENMRLGRAGEEEANTNTITNPGVENVNEYEYECETEQCVRAGPPAAPYTGVCAPLLEALVGRYANLSVQKFSSNVVEKILMLGPDAVRRTVIEELGQADRMAVVVSSVYGQYVIKRALKVASPEQQAELQKSISEHLFHVGNRQMRLKWKKMIYSRRDEEEGDE